MLSIFMFFMFDVYCCKVLLGTSPAETQVYFLLPDQVIFYKTGEDVTAGEI